MDNSYQKTITRGNTTGINFTRSADKGCENPLSYLEWEPKAAPLQCANIMSGNVCCREEFVSLDYFSSPLDGSQISPSQSFKKRKIAEFVALHGKRMSKVSFVPAPLLVGIEPNPGPNGRGPVRKRTNGRKPPVVVRRVMPRLSVNPPQFKTSIRTTIKLRFKSSGAFSGLITNIGLLDAAGVIGTVVNSTVGLVYQSVRLIKVEAWAPPATQGTSATISLNWYSTRSPNTEVSDTTLSTAHNAHICTHPPNMSVAAFWNNFATSTTLFTLDCPTQTVIDVVGEFVQVDQAAAPTQATIGTVVVGNFYYLALDNDQGTDQLIPISRLTTT